MSKLSALIGDITHVKLGGADSFSDQLNCKYTVFVYSLLIVVSTTRVYIDDPITCFCPTEFSGSQVAYTNKICWVSDTYSLKEDELPTNGSATGWRINYYQWITLLMGLQAFCFFLPRAVWKMLNKKSGIAVSSITDAAIECYRKSDTENTDRAIKYMSTQLNRLLTNINRTGYRNRCCQGPSLTGWYYNGSYLVLVYLSIKLIYLINAIGQLFVLGAVLRTDYHMYGIKVLQSLMYKGNFSNRDVFPRDTICHFNLKKLGNIQRFSIQCALPMNFFYEMMFIYLWFWIVFVATCTAISLLWWSILLLRLRFQVRYIYSLLVDMEEIPPQMQSEAKKFVTHFLRRDGCFIIKLVSRNSSEILANQLTCALWQLYCKKNEKYGSIDPPSKAQSPTLGITNEMQPPYPTANSGPRGYPPMPPLPTAPKYTLPNKIGNGVKGDNFTMETSIN